VVHVAVAEDVHLRERRGGGGGSPPPAPPRGRGPGQPPEGTPGVSDHFLLSFSPARTGPPRPHQTPVQRLSLPSLFFFRRALHGRRNRRSVPAGPGAARTPIGPHREGGAAQAKVALEWKPGGGRSLPSSRRGRLSIRSRRRRRPHFPFGSRGVTR